MKAIWLTILTLILSFATQAQTVLFSRSAAFRQPSALADVALWFRANDIAGADGSAVSSWTARTGQTATQVTGSKQPTLQTSEVNGRSAILSDGTNDWLTLSAAVSAASDFTAITVQKRSASGSLGCVVGSSYLTGGTDIGPPYSVYEYGPLTRTYIGSRTDQKYYAGLPSHAYHVLTVHTSSGTLALWIDGVSQSLNAAAATSSGNFDMLFSRGNGGSPGTSAEYWAVYASEILIWTRALSTAERQAVEDWLGSSSEYNITITH